VDASADPTQNMKNAMKENKGGPGGGGPKMPGMPGMPGGAPGAKAMGTKTKSLIPEKYNAEKTSGLRCKVPEDTGKIKEFPLTSK